MAADIVIDAHRLVIVAQQDQARFAQLDHLRIARFGHIAFQPDRNPVAVKEHLHLCGEHVIARIQAAGQCVPRPTRVEQCRNVRRSPIHYTCHDASIKPIGMSVRQDAPGFNRTNKAVSLYRR